MRFAKIALKGVLVLLILLVLAITASLHFSKIESTASGVHVRLRVPLLSGGTAMVAMPAGTGDAPVLAGFLDGPVVTVKDGAWSARWFCEQAAHARTGTGDTVDIECAGRHHQYRIKPRMGTPMPSVIAMPEKLVVLSDIEGNIGYLEKALTNLTVTNASGRWTFGTNHLVIAGDSVDRGRDVFAVLWHLYHLSQQAKEAGGQVHVLLGNHEQYILRGNTSRAHPVHVFTLNRLGGVGPAFGADTVIGDWLRQQAVVLKAGNVLFTHGGIAPSLAAQGMSLEQMNDGLRRYWRGEQVSKAQLDAILSPLGVTQYRGYLMDGDEQYAMATRQEVEAVASTYGVEHIVIGHSIVEKVSALFGGRVFAIDVNSNTAAPEVLVFVNGRPAIVNADAPRMLQEGKEGRKVRRFDLFSSADWQMLSQQVLRIHELASLPHPY